MPINVANGLPAINVLQSENIFVITENRAQTQDIRPLKILILNLMPNKIQTETQLLRLLGNTPLQVDVELLQTATHTSRHTPSEHLGKFYRCFEDIREQRFDGMVITGAPVELLPFDKVDYWEELCEIMEWSRSHVYSTLHICWGAQAGLFYHYQIPKYPLERKMFGIFPHTITRMDHPLLRGFDELFYVPHSRHTEVRQEDIAKHSELELLAYSEAAGVHLVARRDGRQVFVVGHAEYDRNTLADEYFRDREKGLEIRAPYNYFPDDDPRRIPPFTWRGHGNLLFCNWLNYFVYQATPYDLATL